MKVEFQIKSLQAVFRRDLTSVPQVGNHIVLGDNLECEVVQVTYDLMQHDSIAVITLKLMEDKK